MVDEESPGDQTETTTMMKRRGYVCLGLYLLVSYPHVRELSYTHLCANAAICETLKPQH